MSLVLFVSLSICYYIGVTICRCFMDNLSLSYLKLEVSDTESLAALSRLTILTDFSLKDYQLL